MFRDFIVFTSHKSERKCGVLEPLVANQAASRQEAERREYIEATDKEMDMWLQVRITN